MKLTWITLALAFVGAAHADVTVAQKGDSLRVKGDAASHTLVFEGVGAMGELIVYVDGLTPMPFIGVTRLEVSTGGGDDSVRLSGLQLGGNVRLKLGAGADSLIVNDVAVNEQQVYIGGNLDVSMGDDPEDRVVFDTDSKMGIVVAGRLTVTGAADCMFAAQGGSANAEFFDMTVCGDVVLKSKRAQDLDADGFSLVIFDLNVGGRMTVALGADDDVVWLENTHVSRTLDVRTGGGDDHIIFFSDAVNAATRVDGGKGTDKVRFDANAPSIFAVLPQVSHFESVID